MSRLTTLSNTERLHEEFGKRHRIGNNKSYWRHYSGTKYLRKVIYQCLTKGRNPHRIK
ncbi:hypothetical protein VPHD292_0083 [Vibrio phage D292]